MAFPLTRLPITVELQINGVWTDISTDVRTQGGTDAIAIKRGITATGTTAADPATCTMTLDNNSGNYSSRNPLSPYYPYLGRNTPLRVGATYGTPWLDMSYGGSEVASTPDAAVLDILGDLDLRVDAEMPVWGDAAQTSGFIDLITKYGNPGQRSWFLGLSNGGQPTLFWTPDGTNLLNAGGAAVPFLPGQRGAIRATLDVDNGASGNTVTFYTSTTPGTSGPWTQVGTPIVQSGTTSVFNSTAPVEIGHTATALGVRTARKVYGAEVRNGISGTVVASPNFTAQTAGATSFTDTAPSPRTWTVTAGALTNVYRRFVGEVSEWPPQWDTGGKDVTTPITASGILQRYNQSKTNLQSTLRRRIPSATSLVAYWPMEEGSTATQAASPIANVLPMRTTGFTWAADSSLAGSGPLPQLAAPSSMYALAPGAVLGDWHVELVFKLASLPASPQQMLQVNVSGGTAAVIQFSVGVAVARIAALDASGTTLTTLDVTPNNFTDGWGRLQIKTSTTGGVVTLDAEWVIIGAATAGLAGITFSGSPGRAASVSANWGSGFDGMSVGHLGIFTQFDPGTYDSADIAFDGETAAARLSRVAGEQGAPLSIAARAADTELVGPQPQDTFLNAITAAAQADEGMLCEAREFLGIRYRGRASLYNQPSALDLPYVATPQALMAPLKPVDDLQGVRNDSTVTRLNGSSGRSVVSTGPLSILDPPNGIGTGYDEDVSLNLHTDGQTAQHAGWRTRIGTWDEARFPEVNLELAKNPTLIPAVARIDTGSRIRITPPLIPQLPPDTIDQLVLGYEENISQFSWRFQFACQPYGPYQVAVTDDTVLGRIGSSGSTLAASATSTATALSVATASGALWTTAPDDWPFDVRAGGETLTVTAVGQVLNPNPSFETNTTGWTANGGATLTQSNAQAKRGTWSALLTTGATSDPRIEGTSATVTAGQQYRAVGWLYAPQALASGVGVNVNWYDGSGTYLSTSTNTRVPTVGAWGLFDAVFTAPATAGRGQIVFACSGTPGTGLLLYGDEIRLIPVASYTSSPQTLTVTRSVNTIVKAQTSGTAIRLATPAVVAL